MNVETAENIEESPELMNVQSDIKEPSKEEVKEALKSLKRNEAPGEDEISADILKAGGDLVINQIHKLIIQVWNEEKLPEE